MDEQPSKYAYRKLTNPYLQHKVDEYKTITGLDGKPLKVGIIWGEEDYRPIIAGILRDFFIK